VGRIGFDSNNRGQRQSSQRAIANDTVHESAVPAAGIEDTLFWTRGASLKELLHHQIDGGSRCRYETLHFS